MTVTKPPTGNRKKVQGQYLSPEEQRVKRARRKVAQMTMADRDRLPAGSIELEAHLQLLEEAAHEKLMKEVEEGKKKVEKEIAEQVGSNPEPVKKIYWKSTTSQGWKPLDYLSYSFESALHPQVGPPPSAPKLPAVPMLPGKGSPIYLEMEGSTVFLGHAEQITAAYDPPFYDFKTDFHSSPKPSYTIKLSGPQMEAVLNLLGLRNTCGDPTCADHIVKIA